MREVLEDLLAKCQAQREMAGVWAEGLLLEGYSIAMTEAIQLIQEQIQIEKLGE